MPINLTPSNFIYDSSDSSDSSDSTRSWFNTYGSYIIETKWNPKKREYITIYHQYNNFF